MRKENYPKLFVIILNYNGKETIGKCLDSVFYSDYPNFEAVVVDNNSKDGSLETAKKLFPKFHFIKNEKNIGFAAGNNVGIRFALERMADYVFLLNNDAFLEKNTLSRLIEWAEKNKVGIWSPLIYNREGKIWFSGGEISWQKIKVNHKNNPPRSKKPYPVEYVSGCAMLVKKEVFKKAGLFDESYFLYYEDIDFCLSAKKNGFECFLIPEAKVMHLEKNELNLSNKIYWLVISGLIFFEKNNPRRLKLWTRPHSHILQVKNMIDGMNDKKYSKIIDKAYNDFKIWKKTKKYPL